MFFVLSPDSSWGRKKTQKRPGERNNKHTELPKTSGDLGTFGTVKYQPPLLRYPDSTNHAAPHITQFERSVFLFAM